MGVKAQRVDEANKVIAAIAEHGRQFFYHKGRVSRFEIDWQGRVWFRDKYTNRRVSLHRWSSMKGFTEGGTLATLVRDLHHFIRTGEPIRRTHFGPWPGWLCDGDLWGYGDDMPKVREAVTTTDAVAA